MELEDMFSRPTDEIFEDTEHENLAWVVKEFANEIQEEIKSTKSTWETLMEDPEFRSKTRKSQKIIWELAKIRENDSPKNQVDVAKQYGVTDAHVSQLAEYFEP